MFKRNIQGAVGAIEIVLIVIVLAVAGLVVWRVMSADEKEATGETTTEETTDEATTEDSATKETDAEESANSITIDKLDVRFSIDDDAPDIVITDNPDTDYSVYFSTQEFIDLSAEVNIIDSCVREIGSLSIFSDMDALRQSIYMAEQYSDQELRDEFQIHELSDGRLWYYQAQSQAVCYDPDPSLQFTESNKITPYLESLETI